jgi:hypothetical protein
MFENVVRYVIFVCELFGNVLIKMLSWKASYKKNGYAVCVTGEHPWQR